MAALVTQGRARFHRRGAALDRRSVPAEQDRGGPARRHPRVHRLQHLRLQRQSRRAHALHAEPDERRGMAPRLASRAHRRRATTDDNVLIVGAGPAGLEAARALGERGYEVMLAEATPRARRPRRPRMQAAGPRRPGAACATGAWRSSTSCRKSRSSARAGWTPSAVLEAGCSLVGARDRRHLAPRRRRALARSAAPGPRSEPRLHARRHHGGRQARGARRDLRRRPLLHGRRHRGGLARARASR